MKFSKDLTKEMTCIACPRGCRIRVEVKNKPNDQGTKEEELVITGNKCSKGKAYARQEMICPLRMLTSTVRTTFVKTPRLSVKLSREVPLRDIFLYMELLQDILVDHPVIPGDVLKKNLLGKEVDLLASGEVGNEE